MKGENEERENGRGVRSGERTQRRRRPKKVRGGRRWERKGLHVHQFRGDESRSFSLQSDCLIEEDNVEESRPDFYPPAETTKKSRESIITGLVEEIQPDLPSKNFSSR